MNTEFFCRQTSLVAPRLSGAEVVVVGLGTVGSWTALALARTGAQLWLYDPDTVAPENIGCQAYTEPQIGTNKAIACASLLRGFDVRAHPQRFPCISVPGQPAVVVSCVDSFAERRRVAWWASQAEAELFIDTRMGGLVGMVIPVRGEQGYMEYLEGLPSDADIPPMACGAVGTGFVGMWVAARVAAEVNEAMNNRPVHASFWHIGANIDIGPARKEVRAAS